MKRHVGVLSLVLVFAMSMKAGATSISTWDAVYERQADGSYKYVETYLKEDGTKAKNEWIKFGDSYGAKVWKYYGPDGYVLTNTTTPDGFLVNDRGEWYKHCPAAAYCDVEDYHHENVYYPFSYDGETAKNDHLGMALNYTEKDYQSGFELNMNDTQGAMSYAAFSITSPNGGSLGVVVRPVDISTDEYISGWLGSSDSTVFWTDTVPEERMIGGKLFRGYRTTTTFYESDDPLFSPGSSTAFGAGEDLQGAEFRINTGYSVSQGHVDAGGKKIKKVAASIVLGCRNVDGGSVVIGLTPESEADEELMFNWINSHLTFSK